MFPTASKRSEQISREWESREAERIKRRETRSWVEAETNIHFRPFRSSAPLHSFGLLLLLPTTQAWLFLLLSFVNTRRPRHGLLLRFFVCRRNVPPATLGVLFSSSKKETKGSTELYNSYALLLPPCLAKSFEIRPTSISHFPFSFEPPLLAAPPTSAQLGKARQNSKKKYTPPLLPLELLTWCPWFTTAFPI